MTPSFRSGSPQASPGEIVISIDVRDRARFPAFRATIAAEKKDRKPKTFQIDKEMESVLKENVAQYQQSDVINMGINLVAVMNGWR